MHNSHFPRRIAFVLTALVCMLFIEVSFVQAEGYQLSQNLQPNQSFVNYKVSGDGKYAVYQIDTFDENFNQSSQLFSVNTATKERRAITPVIGGDGKFLGSYKITPNSQFVIYTASLESDASFRSELYSIPIFPSSQSQRRNIGNISATSQADIFNFDISPDSRHVVYQLSDENAAGDDFEILFRVAPTGGAVTQLTPRTPDGEAEDFIFAPDSSRIVYEYDSPANENTLYQSVSITGTGRKTLTDRTSGGAEPRITSDSERFVFAADFSAEGGGETRLYSITLAGSEGRKQLSRNGEEVYNFEFANGFPLVVYAFKPTSAEGFSPTSFGFVAADKSFESVSFNTGKQINTYNFKVTPDNRAVVYLAAAESFGSEQLYSLTFQNNAPVDQKISNAAMNQAPFESVSDFKIAPNSSRVVFRATQGGAFTPDLFSVAIANYPTAVKLNNLPGENGVNAADFGVGSYFITPNSGRVIFGYSRTDGGCCGNDFYTNAIAGGTPTGPFATAVNDDSFGGGAPVLTADARRIVYTKTVFDEFGDQSTSLWAANVPQ